MAEKFIEMELREIQTVEDPERTQIIILEEKDGTRAFPIFIGLYEAKAMVMAAKGERTLRPLTHELVLNVIDGLGATLERVLIVELKQETFFGALELRSATGEVIRIDSRPSDAIVIGTRRRVPLFVEEKVLREVQRGLGEEETEEKE